MTPDKKRAILESAAKACGYVFTVDFDNDLTGPCVIDNEGFPRQWDTIDNSLDTSAMCARLDINTFWWHDFFECYQGTCSIGDRRPHDGTPEGKEAAWRLAASMVAAKVAGYEDA